MRLINADDSFTINASDNTGYSLAFGGGIISCIDELGHIEAEFFADDIPTVDAVQVVHGRWLKAGYVCGEGEFECSVCHKTEWRTTISRFDWCPFCGARMDGDGDAEKD